MNLRRFAAVFSLLVLASCAKSEPLPGDSVSADGAVRLTPTKSGGARAEPIGAIESRLYPPELVMEHQAEIALTSAQREAISREVERGQSEMQTLQWELNAEKEKLVKLLEGDKVDEAKSNEVAAALMDRENKIKSAHLRLLVRVKNVLEPAQQKKLQAAREAERCDPSRK
jgi:hypothetical protein